MTARHLIRFVGPCDCDDFDPMGEYAPIRKVRCSVCGVVDGHSFRCPERDYQEDEE